MSVKIEKAVERFKSGFNCSQSVFGSYSEQFGLDCDKALRIATGFGGGMRMSETCGAVTGAFMVLSLKYGNTTAQDSESKAETYEKIEEYTARFKARNGSVKCRDLLGCDISTQDGRKEALDKDLFSTVCPEMVKIAAEILENMLAEDSS
ncbi:MAG: C_GCAxxG_C_C family protein [Sedimentisphaerales bacterium]|nr:C_GCAxxG_C_C family protein [Sedimentisphaerales bacterium]